jgi:epoxyqueuosine reductase QueG
MTDRELTATVLDYVLREGACAAGIATTETLAGGPPSADLSYVLSGARSAVSFALPFDQAKIPPYLRKEDLGSHERDNLRTETWVSGLAAQLAAYLDQMGHPSVAVLANRVYREDTPGGVSDLVPPISQRYLAVRSGVGWFGLSGNVITRSHGAGVLLGSVVTAAELAATDPLPEEEKYCNECRLCQASCASLMMDPKEKTTVTLGGVEFSYSKRRNYNRCGLVCGGFAGLDRSGKWSTWSPGRFPIPESDEEFASALAEGMLAWSQRPEMPGGFYHPQTGTRRLSMTCGNCQLVCHPDRDERKSRYKMLTGSGVVVQKPDGSLEALSPSAARRFLDGLSPETRALYEKV